MDLVSVSSELSFNYSSLYKSSNQKSDMVQAKENAVQNPNTNGASNIILVKKGSTGYMTDVDFDEDGKITLEELNKYCDENGVSEKVKIELMTTMEFSKVKDSLIDKNVESSIKNPTDSKIQGEESSVYAKKGDDKYNEAMDSNKDRVVTYEEYVKYCMEQAGKNEKNSSTENSKYSNKGKSIQSEELVSTVEFEV